ncbi:MAG: hypothetical protein NTW86_07370 [Candidatus Sumerlaeota bacterium]|nr:hypothetical protein [Candidatus Sumerlaeota bacterium]
MNGKSIAPGATRRKSQDAEQLAANTSSVKSRQPDRIALYQEGIMATFPPVRFRQIFLDFHTSEHIPDVGSQFDEEQFITCLQQGRVESIMVFAMCHHGWCYYDTQVGKRHPNLRTDLLPRMLAACKANGIDAPIYVSVGWNELAAREHPEWVCRKEDGTVVNAPKPGKPDDRRFGG